MHHAKAWRCLQKHHNSQGPDKQGCVGQKMAPHLQLQMRVHHVCSNQFAELNYCSETWEQPSQSKLRNKHLEPPVTDDM